MSHIEVYRNMDQGPAWCAIGTLGDAGYYAGADSRDELLALIQEASEMEGVTPTISIDHTNTTPTRLNPSSLLRHYSR